MTRLEFEDEEFGAGEAGEEGEEGTDGGGKGGRGGRGGRAGRMTEPYERVIPASERGSDLVRNIMTFFVLIAVVGALGVGGMSLYSNITVSHKNDVEDCDARADLVDMQRLFLAEHAAIRTIMDEAGLPTEHADPVLLEKLEILIENADCPEARTIEERK